MFFMVKKKPDNNPGTEYDRMLDEAWEKAGLEEESYNWDEDPDFVGRLRMQFRDLTIGKDVQPGSSKDLLRGRIFTQKPN